MNLHADWWQDISRGGCPDASQVRVYCISTEVRKLGLHSACRLYVYPLSLVATSLLGAHMYIYLYTEYKYIYIHILYIHTYRYIFIYALATAPLLSTEPRVCWTDATPPQCTPVLRTLRRRLNPLRTRERFRTAQRVGAAVKKSTYSMPRCVLLADVGDASRSCPPQPSQRICTMSGKDYQVRQQNRLFQPHGSCCEPNHVNRGHCFASISICDKNAFYREPSSQAPLLRCQLKPPMQVLLVEELL